jgi:excisionase family DNA binding protein
MVPPGVRPDSRRGVPPSGTGFVRVICEPIFSPQSWTPRNARPWRPPTVSAATDRCPLVRPGIRCRGLEPLAQMIGERRASWSTQVKNDEVLTIKEVAALLKLAEKTVYSMAQQGELPAFKVRGQWRIRRSELDRWIDEQPRGKANAQG